MSKQNNRQEAISTDSYYVKTCNKVCYKDNISNRL